jgi:hypothetical protein
MVTVTLDCFLGARTTWARLLMTSVTAIFGTKQVSRISVETAEIRMAFGFCATTMLIYVSIFTL